MKKQHEAVQQRIASSCAGLKEDIEAEAISYGDIVLANVTEWVALETKFDNDCSVDFREVLAHEDAVADLEDLYSICKAVQEFSEMRSADSSIVEALGFAEVDSIDALLTFFKAAVSLEEMLRRVEGTYSVASNDLSLVRNLSVGDVVQCRSDLFFDDVESFLLIRQHQNGLIVQDAVANNRGDRVALPGSGRQLLKHFRSYKELISYSNTSFYRDKLQVMKIRGKPI